MSNSNKKEPLKEIWLFHSSPHGISVTPRVFAKMGEMEIDTIAEDISECYDGFRATIAKYIKEQIKSELAKGETYIYIDDDSDDMTEFFIVKVELDSGYDWSGTSEAAEVEEDEKRDVYPGDNIYATLSYYGGIDALYSDEFFVDMTPLKIE